MMANTTTTTGDPMVGNGKSPLGGSRRSRRDMSGGSGNPETKIENWWKGQMYGHLPSGEAEILVTGHYHHFRSKQQGNRTWFQTPSLDKSIDFTSRTGLWSHPGVLTFTVNKKGWDNLAIL